MSTSRMLISSGEATCRHNHEGERRAGAIRWRGIPVRWPARFSRANGGASPRVQAGGPSMLKRGSHNIVQPGETMDSAYREFPTHLALVEGPGWYSHLAAGSESSLAFCIFSF